MVDADVQSPPAPNDPGNNPNLNPPAQVWKLDLNDKSFSYTFSKPDLDIGNLEDEFLDFIKFQDARDRIESFLSKASNGDALGEKDLHPLTSEVLQHTNTSEKALIIHSLLSQEPSPASYTTIINVLHETGFGEKLNSTERHLFFAKLQEHNEVAVIVSLLQETQAAETMSSSYVRDLLTGVAESLPPGAVRDRFTDPNTSLRELCEVFEHVDSQTRMSVMIDLIVAGASNPEVTEFILEKLDNLLHFTPMEDRVSLTESLLTVPDEWTRDFLCGLVFRSSADLKELSELINRVGVDRILEAAGPQMAEYVSHAVLGPQVREVQFPDQPTPGAEPRDLERVQAEIEAALNEIIRICGENEKLTSTIVAQDYIHTARGNLDTLAEDLQALVTAGEGVEEALQIYCAKLPLEFRYGVYITTGESEWLMHGTRCEDITHGRVETPPTPTDLTPEQLSSGKAKWTLRDIEDIRAVLEAIPEGDLLFTKMLRNIELVDSLGWGVLGGRFTADGKIKIASLAIEDQSLSSHYKGVSSLRIVLAHEIGHGLQIGVGSIGFQFGGSDGPGFAEGEHMFDFEEWVKISGWTVYAFERVDPSETAGKVILDGEEIELNTTVEHEGKKKFFTYIPQWNILISYDTDSEFSSRWYSKTSPWEDFAEAFSEYLFLPERLIQTAPNKFKHLEEEFRRYDDDPRMKELLETALTSSQLSQDNGS